MKSKIILLIGLSALLVSFTSQAQSISLFGTNLTAAIKTLQPFTTNRAAMLQIGGGENTASHKAIVAGALTIPTGKYTAVGIVGGWTPGAGFEYGAATLQLGITNNVELALYGVDISLGKVHSFVEDGPVYSWRSHAAGNFFATGTEKSWTISKYAEAGIGVLIDNDSTRSGMDIMGGGHLQVHGANAVPLSLQAVADHAAYSFRKLIDPTAL